MSHKCNPATYYQEVLRFLHVDAMALDSGHCEPLRRDAWAAARGSNALQTEAILHLLSQPVQEELATFAMAIETSTLDVERKHNLDRHSEARHVASVGKSIAGWICEALADAVARRSPNYKGAQAATRRHAREQGLPFSCNTARPLPSSTWKIAFGQKSAGKSLRSDRPLQRLLREYVEEHKDELEVEARQRHSRAQKGLPRHVTSWPLSKAEWVRW